MKQSLNSKRHHRGRGSGRRQGHGFASSFESSGPDVKIKGSASHVFERYQSLARDAIAVGDRVAAENFLQHAEHYQRIMNAHLAAAGQQPDANGQGRQINGRDDDDERAQDGGTGPFGDEGPVRVRGRARSRPGVEPDSDDDETGSSDPFRL